VHAVDDDASVDVPPSFAIDESVSTTPPPSVPVVVGGGDVALSVDEQPRPMMRIESGRTSRFSPSPSL
jgi:hypothetical protein